MLIIRLTLFRPKPWFCTSSIVLFFWVWVVDKLSADTLLNILVFCAIFSLALFSPIDSERRHLNTDQKKQYRIITIFITIIFWVIYELLLYMEFEVYAVCIAEGIMLTAILQIPCVVKKYERNLTCKNKTLNEDNRYKWNKATLTHILTRQEYCGDVVNFKTTKHFRDKRNHYVDRSQWHITENVHEPIIDRTDFENVQRILENAPVKRPNGDGEIHPLSGLLFCKDCGAKMHIRIDYRNGGKRHVAYCSEYHKGKDKNPKCSSPHIMDADLLMQTVADVLKKIAEYSISNRAEFEALVKADMNKANEVRPIFRRLAEVAERTRCAVILIGHLNKAAGGQSAYRGLGSIDFRAAARSVLLIGRVKREPNVRVIIHDKSSLAPEGKPVAFCLDPETGFEWIGEYDITADELLSGAGGNNATKTEQAEKLILDLLADGKEFASEDIEKAAADAGISARTVRAAKKNLDGRITSKRIGAAWYHALKK